MMFNMRSSIEYRSEKPDISGYFPLFASTGWNGVYRLSNDEVKASIDKSWHCVSAYCGDRLVGFGRIVSDGRIYALVCDMVVDEAFRNRGIGTAILDMLVEKCRRENIRAVWLFAAAGKRRFYEKRGFAARPDEGPGMYLKP
jgi:GNAT superfamily N-acetyltransferase